MTQAIEKFSGDYRWLSNFYQAEVTYNKKKYKTVEHAYQAAKTLDLKIRKRIRESGNPAKAKAMGRAAPLRSGWEKLKIGIMRELVREKFTRHAELRAKLLATGDAKLVEGNTWKDDFWGVYNGKGKNWLGKILMEVRESLKPKTESATKATEGAK